MIRRYAPLYPTPNTDPIIREICRLPYVERQKVLIENIGYPAHLYRYTSLDPEDDESIDRLRQVLIESVLWLSSPADFNDPFDMTCHVIFDGTGPEKRHALSNKFKQMALTTTWKKRNQRIDVLLANPEDTLLLIRGIFRENLQAAGVCCFTPDPCNLLMWSHYANNHKGLILEFDPAHDPDVLTRPAKVEYSDEYPVINWIKDTQSQLKQVMLQKCRVLEYEREWRITHPNGGRTHQVFNPAALTGVIIGCRATDALKAKLQELLVERENRRYPAITVYQSKMHGTRYELVLGKV